MSKQDKKGMVPELRFPEFMGDKEWTNTALKPYLEPYSERVKSDTELDVFSSTRSGLKPQSEYYDGRKLVNEGEYGIVPDGYFVYRHMSDDNVFKFNINKFGKKIAVSKEYPVFKTLKLSSEFLLNLLNEGQEFKRFAVSQKKGGTRTRLYFKTLCTFKPSIPTLDEQQKIADCLSSIDELITSETQKLEAYKKHKKGLAKNLFPNEEEQTPKLRFPEFSKKKAWMSETIGNIAAISSGGTPNRTQNEYWNGSIPWVTTTLINFNTIKHVNETISELGLKNSSAKIYPINTILMAMYGQGKTRGQVAKLGIEATTNQACAALNLNSKVYFEFVFQNLAARYDEIRQISNDGGQKNLSAALIKKITFSYPDIETGEQQKIAACLTSLDELISNQSKKISLLQNHKKGLIQQLFPAIDEADA